MDPNNAEWYGEPEEEGTILVSQPSTERYARQALKYTKSAGWTYETTVSIKTTDDEKDMVFELERLNRQVRLQAIDEIAMRTVDDERYIADSVAMRQPKRDMSGYTPEDYDHGGDDQQ